MDIDRFTVYQLRDIPENRGIRFQSYKTLQGRGIQIRPTAYAQVYQGYMQPGDTPEGIRKRLDKQLPRTFKGHSISVSDVLVLEKGGAVASYYIEKDGSTALEGFIQERSPNAVSFGAAGLHIGGREGSWVAFDNITMEGREFFLMENEEKDKDVAWAVVDTDGALVVDDVRHGFDQAVRQKIQEYIHPPQAEKVEKKERPPLEGWQKYMENGEYLRSSEIDEEQNYNMIDGNRNNGNKKKGRPSVLAKLRQKQAGIAARGGRPAQQLSMDGDMERRRG